MVKPASSSYFTLAVLLLAILCKTTQGAACRYLPGDSHWPSTQEWNTLNATVGGRLIATVPLATVCHGDKFNSTACASIKQDWAKPLLHEESPSSIMAPYYQNQSCDPFTPQSKPCELGNYVSYSINASTTAEISAGIRFAQSKNIRLVIKSTGHDFLGRSTGTGGLSIWTHNLRSQEFIPKYTSSAYNGPAFKFGSGIRGFEAIDFGNQHGYQTVTGDCPTIGVIGGYLQGGGSGPLASTNGMAADHVLEYEVVTANGEVVTASPTKNSDLYWALSGGGGGTYGVVVSATLRVFKDGVTGGASLSFSRDGISNDTVYDILGTVFDLVPSLIDAGMHFSWVVFKTSFSLGPLTAPGFTTEQLQKALGPLTTKLDGLGIKYQYKTTSLPDFRSHFQTYLGPLPSGIYGANGMVGSRMLPRASLVKNRTEIIEATRDITENTASFISYIAANVSHSSTKQPVADNAVLPQWRDAAVLALVTLSWDFEKPQKDMLAQQTQLQDYVMPRLRSVLPSDAGTYLNEAEVGIKSWKQDFFGSNYGKLRQIKSLYDPDDTFWAEYSVGSDQWYKAGDGRLCRKDT